MTKEEIAKRLDEIKTALISGQAPGVITDTLWLSDIETVCDALEGLKNHVLTGQYYETSTADRLCEAAFAHFQIARCDQDKVHAIRAELDYAEGARTMSMLVNTGGEKTTRMAPSIPAAISFILRRLGYSGMDVASLLGVNFVWQNEVKEFAWDVAHENLLFVNRPILPRAVGGVHAATIDKIIADPPKISDKAWPINYEPQAVDTSTKRQGVLTTEVMFEKAFESALVQIGCVVLSVGRSQQGGVVRYLVEHPSLDPVVFGDIVPEYFISLSPGLPLKFNRK